jgi:hypothetical protein
MEETSWAGSSATLITHRWLSPGQPPSVAVIGFGGRLSAQAVGGDAGGGMSGSEHENGTAGARSGHGTTVAAAVLEVAS